MNLIKIDTSKLDKNIYGFSGLRFTVGMKPVNRFVDIIFPFQSCREDVCSRIRQEFRKREDNVRIDLGRTHLLICARFPRDKNPDKKFCAAERKKLHKQMIISQKLVNHWEKRHGWLLTKLYEVDTEGDIQSGLYMAIGSSKWQRTPHYLSLYMLMLRLGRSGLKDGPWETPTAIMNRLNTFARGNTIDSMHVQNTITKWDVFLANQSKLVGKKSMKDMFSRNRLAHHSSGRCEGITTLCNGSSYDLLFSYKFQNVCRGVGIHQRVSCKPDIKITGDMK